MEAEVLLDTHVLIWLYEGDLKRFSKRAKEVLESAELLVSPMSLLELDYLFETKRIVLRSQSIFQDLSERIGLQIAEGSFIDVVNEASSLRWTRDPFDRLITAHARLRGVPLLTKDRFIKRHFPHTVW